MLQVNRPFKNYPGNKSQHGLAQKIISIMPPHDVYIETFLGSGAILSMKKPAKLNVGNDIDKNIWNRWKHLSSRNFVFTNLDCSKVISNYDALPKRVLFYHDPPYLKSVRRSRIDIYKHEMNESGHIDFLNSVISSKQLHIISGYASELYNSLLQGWSQMSMPAGTRKGKSIEIIWFNFPDPTDIYDYGFLGKNFTDRQRIKRKVARWIAKFEKLPNLERNLIYQELQKKNDLIRGRINADR